MALTPINEVHALQIQAGILGRKTGHKFEDTIAEHINSFAYPIDATTSQNGHIFVGDPALLLIKYITAKSGHAQILHASAISTGSLATSEEGKRWLSINGVSISRCKSDLAITAKFPGNVTKTFGVSTKQCNNSSPTNAQLYFTTARGFVSLLQKSSISVSSEAILALRQFCGDRDFRPSDDVAVMKTRNTDPRRYFWEETNAVGRAEWESLFSAQQDLISRLLFQKAYLDDPFAPDYLLHKTKLSKSWDATEVALYSIDELIALSRKYQGYSTKPYRVKKGSHKDPEGVQHLAPRFGIIQMQRGGQAQHPEQLQFNLEAGYFYKI